jgi:hypothetical protein
VNWQSLHPLPRFASVLHLLPVWSEKSMVGSKSCLESRLAPLSKVNIPVRTAQNSPERNLRVKRFDWAIVLSKMTGSPLRLSVV